MLPPSGPSATWQRVLFILLSAGWLFSVTVPSVTANCDLTLSTGDADALADALPVLGNFSVALPGWSETNTSQACCWNPAALICEEVDGVVRIRTLIILSTNIDFALNGSLPPSFGNLSALTDLDLASNNLQGSVPENWRGLKSIISLNLNGNRRLNGNLDVIASLKTLQSLDIGGNLFSGDMDKLPLGNLTSLNLLYMRDNKFTGVFPSWLGNLRNLTVLNLSLNKLSPSILPEKSVYWPASLKILVASEMNLIGPIPGILGSLPLEDLDLKNNRLNGSIPAEFGNLKAKFGIILDISLNNLTGEIPKEVANGVFYSFIISSNLFATNVTNFLKALCQGNSDDVISILDISNNSFTGEIPPEISYCSLLTSILFSSNRLTGKIPSEITKMVNLTSLNLDDNMLEGQIPTELNKLVNLYYLTLFDNKFTGSLPDLPCQKISVFHAYNNSLSGPLPSSLTNCSGLSELLLQYNQLSGNISFLTKQGTMTILNLANNNFSGSIPSNISWPTLGTLNLSHNSFTGGIPPKLGTKAPKLSRMDLSYNLLSGGIPSTLFEPLNLTFVDLSYNNLNSSLESNFLRSSSLTIAYIHGNKLSGTLPNTTFVYSTSLQELDLRNNSFSGFLPQNLNGSAQLIKLYLSGNSFSGPLPSLKAMSALKDLNISNNKVNGSIPDLPTTLSVIDFGNNYISGSLPSFEDFFFLKYVDFSSNQLSGSLPSDFSSGLNLIHLDFSHNNLNGTIPSIYANLTSLAFFDVSNNFLTGQFPVNLENVSSYGNNSGLCGATSLSPCQNSPPPPNPSPSKTEKTLSTGAIIGIVVGGALLGLIIVVVLCILFSRRIRTCKGDYFDDSTELTTSSLKPFRTTSEGKFVVFQKLEIDVTIEDIARVTENFNDKYLLGRGGFGSVYRATVGEGHVFAVKRLTQGSAQGHEEFQAEMTSLGNVQHRNLVTLVASYSDPKTMECLLIYNFLDGGNLDALLKKAVEWPTRLNVAIGVARGLKYLHHDCIPYIIHRDMKPGNIIMNSEMEAHVSDFGLAKMVDLKKTHVSTKLLGTIGYLAPEYAGKGQASTKSDVFAYGVVLLQLISGKLPTQSQMRQGMSKWAQSNPVNDVIEPHLDGGGVYRKEVLSVLRLGLACTARNPMDRPTMEEVLHTLENIEEFAAGVKEDV